MGRSKKLWVQEAFSKNKGSLHKALHVPKDEKIPQSKIIKAEHSKNPKLRKKAILAETARNFHHKAGGSLKVSPKKMSFRGANRSR